MTVIAAAVTKDGVVMAADSLATSGWEKQYMTTPKLWTANRSAFGAAGVLRAAQVLKHHVDWPKYRPDDEPDFEAYLVKQVVPAIRNGTQGHGVVKNDCGIESLQTSLILATGDQIAEVDAYGCVSIPSSGRAAIGSGYAQALGRLGNKGPWTEDDVVDAVRQAIRTAVGCDGPISVVDTKTLTLRTVKS